MFCARPPSLGSEHTLQYNDFESLFAIIYISAGIDTWCGLSVVCFAVSRGFKHSLRR